MTCEVGNNSPFGDPILDDSWTKVGSSPNSNGLEAISDFNATFDAQNAGGGGSTIDPQLTYSNPSTPQPNNNAFNFNTNVSTTDGVNGLDQTLSPEPSPYEPYPPPFNNDMPSSPYLQSVEVNASQQYHASPLRNEHFTHRRSVSEPPGDMAPTMMFHRENHFLGTPMRQSKAMPLKSLPNNKAQRNHPYAAAASRKSTRSHPYPHPHPMEQPPPPPGYRPNVHRSQTHRPVRSHHEHPTSAPLQMPPYQFAPQHRPHSQAQMMPEQHFTSISTSRMCTPIPEAVMMSPSAIDPALTQPRTSMRLEKRQTVSIPLTVDELRSMIFEVVQKAVGRGDGKEQADDAVGSGGPKEMDGEEAEDKDAGVQKVEERGDGLVHLL